MACIAPSIGCAARHVVLHLRPCASAGLMETPSGIERYALSHQPRVVGAAWRGVSRFIADDDECGRARRYLARHPITSPCPVAACGPDRASRTRGRGRPPSPGHAFGQAQRESAYWRADLASSRVKFCASPRMRPRSTACLDLRAVGCRTSCRVERGASNFASLDVTGLNGDPGSKFPSSAPFDGCSALPAASPDASHQRQSLHALLFQRPHGDADCFSQSGGIEGGALAHAHQRQTLRR